MSTYRYLTLLAIVVAALALPASAGGGAGRASSPETTRSSAQLFMDASQTNPLRQHVTVNPGETVTFSYPTGTSVHNVGVQRHRAAARLAARRRRAPTSRGSRIPPLPAVPPLPGLGRGLHVHQRGHVQLLLRRSTGR